MANKPWHSSPDYRRLSAKVRAAANASPNTRCWRCGRTLDEHPPHKNGKPARWQAGHLVDGAYNGDLRPEASTCNTSAGASSGNRRRRSPNAW